MNLNFPKDEGKSEAIGNTTNSYSLFLRKEILKIYVVYLIDLSFRVIIFSFLFAFNYIFYKSLCMKHQHLLVRVISIGKIPTNEVCTKFKSC